MAAQAHQGVTRQQRNKNTIQNCWPAKHGSSKVCKKSRSSSGRAPSDPVMNGPHQMQPLQTSTVENFAC